MYRDFWVYQEVEKEPYACHIYAFSNGFLDLCFYAEYAKAGTWKDLHVNATYEDFFDAFELFFAHHGKPMNKGDTLQIGQEWARIAKEMNY